MKKFLFALAVALLAALPLSTTKTTAANTNLIANPSVEEVANAKPTNWSSDKWGTNTVAFNYLNTGHTGTHSLQVKVSAYTSGDAKWYFTPIAVAPNTQYTFSEWYQGNVASGIDAVITSTTGTTSYQWVANPAASTAWKQLTYSFKTPANAKTLTIYHYLEKVGQLTTDDFDLEGPGSVPAPQPPVNTGAPVVSGTTQQGKTLTISNGTWNNSPTSYSYKWQDCDSAGNNCVNIANAAAQTYTLTSADVNHTVRSIVTAMNTGGSVSVTSAQTAVVTAIPTPPTVQITSPANNATVSGSQTVAASASDAEGVTSVQFKLDNNNLGSAVTTAPYSVSWDTTKAANGNHTLTAVATNKSNLTTTSTAVTVNVQNVVTPPPSPANLIANPSFETAASATAPQGWISDTWGTNTTAFSYLNTGHTGTHSVKVESTAYTNGASEWYYSEVPVTSPMSIQKWTLKSQ
jgi:hypothetical protein